MTRSLEVRSLEDLSFIAKHTQHILTLFSGGVDSSYLLYKLSQYGCKVTALTIDLGDGVVSEDLQYIAEFFGVRLKVIDARERFIEQAIIPAIQANAKYMGIYPISSSLSRPIIVQYAVELAKGLGCDAILHTANQSQNSLRRLNGALRQLNFPGYIGSPYEYSAFSREEKIKSLCQIGLDRFQARGISGDANLWVREYESGELDNPEDFSVPERLFKWTAKPSQPLSSSMSLTLGFESGKPVSINNTPQSMIELIDTLNNVAGKYGIGRYSGLEHLEGGEKVLEVREAPAATLLMAAYRHLETAVLDANLLRNKLAIEQIWVCEAIEGRWFGQLSAATAAFIQKSAEEVTGSVTFSLRPGVADLTSVHALNPLYLTDRDGWEKNIAIARGCRSLAELSSSLTNHYALSA
ncbi:argininosuccinate synthase-related protein [Pectobacteriaceae bacterium CE90]|nr:argininosuccinate synthase-related protein [Pectobacteriaceae bacterium CE90]